MATGTIDVAVVGASAAGLAAALASARAGARTVLLEARAAIGEPEPPAIVGFDMLWAHDPPPADCVRRRLDGVRIASPIDRAHALDVGAPLRVLDRTRFDRHLAGEAARAGAEIRLGVAGLRVEPDRTLVAPGMEALKARVVVFADGHASLARAFLRPTRDARELRWGAELAFDAPGAAAERYVTITMGSHAPGGRAQLTPLDGDRWVHWTFSKGAREDAEAHARRALRLDAEARGWSEDVAKRARLVTVAPDAVYTLPRELVADGVMVAGGAAGQGGLEVGLASGDMAGHVAAACAKRGQTRRADLEQYERAWKREYMAGYRALQRAARRLARLDDRRLDALLAPWAGWRVPARDIIGLGHASPVRRAEAFAKFVARNPMALAPTLRAGWRALLPVQP